MLTHQTAARHESPETQQWSSSGFISHLPSEIIINILEHLRPCGPFTTSKSNCEYPEVERAYFDARSAFANLCVASKWTRSVAIEYLYRTVVIASNLELLRFFRTITNNPKLRPMVRSFAWAVVLEHDQVEFDGWDTFAVEISPLDSNCWESINWPLIGDDICEIMDIKGSARSAYWKLLGVTFSITPNINSIFALHSRWRSGMIQYCPGNELFMKLLKPPSVSKTFLQKLETITLETWPGTPSRHVAETITALIINSPIRRIELKYRLSFIELLQTAEKWGLKSFSAQNIKELFLFELWPSPDEMVHIGTLFPQLISLEIDYETDGYEMEEDTRQGLSKSLLQLSKTLERLSISCAPARYPNQADIPPMLPDISNMTVLRHLSISFVWLFGTAEAFKELRRVDHLPPTLTSLHLLDYWSDHLNDHSNLSSQFRQHWNSEDLYGQALSRLHENCLTRLRHLKIVTVVLSPFDFDKDAERLLGRFKSLFALSGVQLRIITGDVFKAEAWMGWSNLDSVR